MLELFNFLKSLDLMSVGAFGISAYVGYRVIDQIKTHQLRMKRHERKFVQRTQELTQKTNAAEEDMAQIRVYLEQLHAEKSLLESQAQELQKQLEETDASLFRLEQVVKPDQSFRNKSHAIANGEATNRSVTHLKNASIHLAGDIKNAEGGKLSACGSDVIAKQEHVSGALELNESTLTTNHANFFTDADVQISNGSKIVSNSSATSKIETQQASMAV